MSAVEFSDSESVVLVMDGRRKDTERYGLLLGIVILIISFMFVASCAVFFHCAPLFLVTGRQYFSHLSGAVKVYSPEKNHLCLHVTIC